MALSSTCVPSFHPTHGLSRWELCLLACLMHEKGARNMLCLLLVTGCMCKFRRHQTPVATCPMRNCHSCGRPPVSLTPRPPFIRWTATDCTHLRTRFRRLRTWQRFRQLVLAECRWLWRSPHRNAGLPQTEIRGPLITCQRMRGHQ